MTDETKKYGERLAAVEARQDAHEARLDSFESDMKNRLGKIEEKLDKLWWKMGLVLGGVLGAANYLPDFVKNLS
jgi:hypothetical protein